MMLNVDPAVVEKARRDMRTWLYLSAPKEGGPQAVIMGLANVYIGYQQYMEVSSADLVADFERMRKQIADQQVPYVHHGGFSFGSAEPDPLPDPPLPPTWGPIERPMHNVMDAVGTMVMVRLKRLNDIWVLVVPVVGDVYAMLLASRSPVEVTAYLDTAIRTVRGQIGQPGPFFEPINTGQEFPEGASVRKGTCEFCGRKGKITDVRIALPGIQLQEKRACSECMADHIAGLKFSGGAVYVRSGKDGQFHAVGMRSH